MPNRELTGAEKYRFGYQGQFAEEDEETGLNHFEARLWDSRLGRWLTIDPIKSGFSSYWGMNNNPIMIIDPDGRQGRDKDCKKDDKSPVSNGILRNLSYALEFANQVVSEIFFTEIKDDNGNIVDLIPKDPTPDAYSGAINLSLGVFFGGEGELGAFYIAKGIDQGFYWYYDAGAGQDQFSNNFFGSLGYMFGSNLQLQGGAYWALTPNNNIRKNIFEGLRLQYSYTHSLPPPFVVGGGVTTNAPFVPGNREKPYVVGLHVSGGGGTPSPFLHSVHLNFGRTILENNKIKIKF